MRSTSACAAIFAAAGIIANAAELTVSGPYQHDNLSIWLVHGQDRGRQKYLTLEEAMEQRKVVVYETGNVNQLMVENLSGQDVYIQSGEIVKGGRQDRVLKDDFILPSASGKVDIGAFCVEHGRWTQRGQEPSQTFAASPAAIASPEMKRAVRAKADQREVWNEVAAAQARLSQSLQVQVSSDVSASSYQLALEAPRLQQAASAFHRDLDGLAAQHPNALGYVMAVNGKVTGADVYATHELFRKEWPKLLESSVVEAIGAGRPAGKIAPVSMEDVRAAATGYGARVSAERDVNRRTRNVQAELPQGQVFDTTDTASPAAPVHRSFVTK